MGTEAEDRAAADAAAAAEAAKKGTEEGDKGKDGEGEGEKGKAPSYESLVAGLKEKFVPKEVADALRTELDGVKGTAAIVERIREAVSGGKTDDGKSEAEKAAFYKLLINDPVAAIRQVVSEEAAKTAAANREVEVEREFKKFSIRFPEYKTYEEDMKAELLANPGWFGRPNFIQRVFFDVLSSKNPKMLAEIIEAGRAGTPDPDFIFEGSSQTDHGAGPSGKDILARMKAAGGSTKSFFE
jgi:hypothetical protein